MGHEGPGMQVIEGTTRGASHVTPWTVPGTQWDAALACSCTLCPHVSRAFFRVDYYYDVMQMDHTSETLSAKTAFWILVCWYILMSDSCVYSFQYGT